MAYREIERLKQLRKQILQIRTKRNENSKRNTLRYQEKGDTSVSLFFIFIYKQIWAYWNVEQEPGSGI